jgi:hypothetical protein
MKQKEWRVSGLKELTTDSVSRVEADVGGHSLWFESSDVILRPSAEAIAGCFFLPALAMNAVVKIDSALDPQWLCGTEKLSPIFQQWWGYPLRNPIQSHSVPVAASDQASKASLGADRVHAMCFTGGVDSFHGLLRLGDHIEWLVYAEGLDIPLGDTGRVESWNKSFREIATETGRRAVSIRTNLREHPLFRRVTWEQTHGSALAALGHLMSDRVSSISIPSSFRYERGVPWGSSWHTDRLWSTSRFEVKHMDATLSRHNKLAEIAPEPIVARHLRVCWQHFAPGLNCSRCEKCLRTMVSLEGLSRLSAFSTFEQLESLADLLDEFERPPDHISIFWEEALEAKLEPETDAAIRRLLQRRKIETRLNLWKSIVTRISAERKQYKKVRKT